MNLDDYLALSATDFIRQLPIILVGAIGLWHSIPMRRLFVRAATWASWGFGLLIVHALLSVARDVASAAIRTSKVGRPDEIGLAIAFWSVLAYLPLLFALIVLARSFFLERDRLSSPSETSLSARRSTA